MEEKTTHIVKVKYSELAGRIEKFTEFGDKKEAIEFYKSLKKFDKSIVKSVQLFEVKEVTE